LLVLNSGAMLTGSMVATNIMNTCATPAPLSHQVRVALRITA
jgi:hypothetical protein